MSSIMIFRNKLESMLEKIPTELHEKARKKVKYTLSILGQETMSDEAIACILSEVSSKTNREKCPECKKGTITYSTFGDSTGASCSKYQHTYLLID